MGFVVRGNGKFEGEEVVLIAGLLRVAVEFGEENLFGLWVCFMGAVTKSFVAVWSIRSTVIADLLSVVVFADVVSERVAGEVLVIGFRDVPGEGSFSGRTEGRGVRLGDRFGVGGGYFRVVKLRSEMNYLVVACFLVSFGAKPGGRELAEFVGKAVDAH